MRRRKCYLDKSAMKGEIEGKRSSGSCSSSGSLVSHLAIEFKHVAVVHALIRSARSGYAFLASLMRLTARNLSVDETVSTQQTGILYPRE